MSRNVENVYAQSKTKRFPAKPFQASLCAFHRDLPAMSSVSLLSTDGQFSKCPLAPAVSALFQFGNVAFAVYFSLSSARVGHSQSWACKAPIRSHKPDSGLIWMWYVCFHPWQVLAESDWLADHFLDQLNAWCCYHKKWHCIMLASMNPSTTYPTVNSVYIFIC